MQQRRGGAQLQPVIYSLAVEEVTGCTVESGRFSTSVGSNLTGRDTYYVFGAPLGIFNICSNSMGNGKMIVEFWSAAISVSVDR